MTQFRSAATEVHCHASYPAEGKRAADLIVQDLERGTKMMFGNVTEFAWSERRALLAFTVETEGGAGNGVQLYDASTGAVRVLDSSPSLYRMLAWREKSEDLAVLRSRSEKEFRDTTHVVLAWTRVQHRAIRRELDPRRQPASPPGCAWPSIAGPSGRRMARSYTSGCVAGTRTDPPTRPPQ